MIRLSISNLAWPSLEVEVIAPELKKVGMQGVELAPTAVWRDAPHIPSRIVSEYLKRWANYGIAISGVQSLLYGHPEMQIFDRGTWLDLRRHLTAMIELANGLGSRIVVFGSPKNRIRGALNDSEANMICAEFFNSLIPVLCENNVVLTLEPNAPAYGADYLLHYSDCIELSNLIDSPWVQPQIDTGCLTMVGDSLEKSILTRTPAHVHLSMPDLKGPPGAMDHQEFRQALELSGYTGWIVLEMLQDRSDPLQVALESARWMKESYGSLRSANENI